jgi:predicted nucleic acid-binding protein
VITAVDTGVLLDVFLPDERYGPRSSVRLRDAYDAGAIVICDIVYAELVPAFGNRTELDRALREINAACSPVDTSIAYDGGLRWMKYRRAGGPRERIIADFLIGAHALAVADAFLTRDRGFYKTYFPELTNVSPPDAG